MLFLRGDSPTDTFDYAYYQNQVVNSPTTGTGDQTVFTDDDGKDYLIFSNRSGRANFFVSKLRESDSLRVEPAVRIGYNSAGREGNAMSKLDGKYYGAASALHGSQQALAHRWRGGWAMASCALTPSLQSGQAVSRASGCGGKGLPRPLWTASGVGFACCAEATRCAALAPA